MCCMIRIASALRGWSMVHIVPVAASCTYATSEAAAQLPSGRHTFEAHCSAQPKMAGVRQGEPPSEGWPPSGGHSL